MYFRTLKYYIQEQKGVKNDQYEKAKQYFERMNRGTQRQIFKILQEHT